MFVIYTEIVQGKNICDYFCLSSLEKERERERERERTNTAKC
jgi:hypothetical protein